MNGIPCGEAKVVGVVAALLLFPLVVAAAPDVVGGRTGGGDAVDVVTWRQLRRLVS